MKSQEINKVFIDSLRLSSSIINWKLDGLENNQIIPKELTHDNLLENFVINKCIYKYYCYPACKSISDDEFQRMKDYGFVGDKETALRPYSNIIYGAYYSRQDLVTKLSLLLYSDVPFKVNGKRVINFSDLKPYFKEYAQGFKNGYDQFESSEIKPFLTMFSDKQDYANRVFEFVTKQLFFKHSWSTLKRGFSFDVTTHEILNGFEDGQKQGSFYRAWCIILSNDQLFAPLFIELSKNKSVLNAFSNTQLQHAALPPQQDEKQKPEQGKPTFENNFDNVEPIEIYKHFKTGLVDKGYLTEQELNEYLKAAFELKTKPEKLFKLKHTPSKQKIYTVFYTYYKDFAQKKHNTQKDYVALLGDFFEGYETKTIRTNWAREYKAKI